MDAKLVTVVGPYKGAVLPLHEEESFIGRDEGNQICLEDSAVSRRHCLIRREGACFRLKDLGSQNHTFVNGLQTELHLLQHGDEIRLGRSVFVFVIEDRAPTSKFDPMPLDERELLARSTVLLRPEDALYLDPAKAVEALERQGRVAENLKCMLRVGEAISSVQGLGPLADRLLEILSGVIPARRAAILVYDVHTEEFAPQFWWRPALDHSSGRPPKSLLQRVVKERVSILNSTEGPDSSAAAAGSGVHSVLTVPLPLFSRVIGAIYMDSDDPGTRFEQDHLQLVTGIAGIAAGAIEKALQMERLQIENHRLRAEINIEHNMVGDSPRMRKLYEVIAKVAPSDATVLIGGESGTGKELVARAIHRNSPRAGKPFVAINCAALTETLLESELFGHERGAFTGALTLKKGRLEEANGGTVFLDEVGELASGLQAKLLRVLQEWEFERVGGTRPIKVDIRLIAATNRNLTQAVDRGAFRADLYFRLNVVSITLPSLRERREDILGLASYFVARRVAKTRRRVGGFSEEAIACLRNYDWPGNVRELENAIERALVLGSTELILPDDLPESIAESGEPASAGGPRLREAVKRVKRQLVIEALEQSNGNQTEAAKALGVHANNLRRLMRNLNVGAPESR